MVRFTPTQIAGAFIVDIEPRGDERGFFARGFCAREFEELGLRPMVAQYNVSYNRTKGTLRGMHYQLAPSTEAKFVRCISGTVYEVFIDLRPDSPTYSQHVGVELTSESFRALYIPEMCAVGYQALTDGAAVLYHVSAYYAPDHERGVKHDDPAFGIRWPLPVTNLSGKDAAWPPFAPARAIPTDHAGIS